MDRLTADGVDRDRIARVFADPRMEPFTGLDFGLYAREPHSMYRGFLRPANVAAARRCREENAALLADAENTYGVQASVLAAILYIETGWGRNTGASTILPRLARLAMANEPENLRRNILRLTADDEDFSTAERVRERARYLEDLFYPEVRATFTLADRLGTDPLALRGSPSGAVGVPQFLPTSYLTYGTDADGDGRVDLFDPADAVASCANYLAAQGWSPGLSSAGRRAIIWRYNRSDAYVDTVLALAARLDGAPAPPVRSVGRPRRKPTAKVQKARAMAKPRTAQKARTTQRAAQARKR
jgi:membrane-bound lytic murein transglycosylase B